MSPGPVHPDAHALPRVSARELLQRLEREHSAAGPGRAIVTFDADGTLWSADTGVELFGALVDADGIREVAREALAAEATSIGINARGSANDIGRSLLCAFDEGRYDEERGLSMMAWAFAGWTVAEVEAFTNEVLDRSAFDRRVHTALRPILDWTVERCIETWICSASPIAVVRVACARVGIPGERVLGMVPAMEGGEGGEGGVIQPRLAA